MKKIEKAEDAYELMGAIIAFVPKSYYYGQGKGDILSSKIVFAMNLKLKYTKRQEY